MAWHGRLQYKNIVLNIYLTFRGFSFIMRMSIGPTFGNVDVIVNRSHSHIQN